MKMKTGQLLLISLPAALLLGACAGEPTMTERNFGDSVRQMITAQTYDQSTLSAPSDRTVESTDGQMLQGAIDAYRSAVSDQGGVSEPINISVNN